MKKLFLSFFFFVFCFSVDAQNIIDRETIKNSSSEIRNFTLEDIAILQSNFPNFTEEHGIALTNIFYNKYKMLIGNLTDEDLEDLVNSTKETTKLILGEDLYLEVSENPTIFKRISGEIYLNN